MMCSSSMQCLIHVILTLVTQMPCVNGLWQIQASLALAFHPSLGTERSACVSKILLCQTIVSSSHDFPILPNHYHKTMSLHWYIVHHPNLLCWYSGLVNVGDDPHFSIVLPGGKVLCYTVQGEHGFSFNLITSTRLIMNAMFIPDTHRKEVTWLGSIGVVVANSQYQGSNITKLKFDVDTKEVHIAEKVTLKAKNIEKLTFHEGKLTISEAPPKEGFQYPAVMVNLSDVGLTFTIKFTGSHLDMFWHSVGEQREDSHGLVGKMSTAL